MEHNIFVLLFLIVVHYVADFLTQTSHIGKNKSTSNYYLTMHVSFYSITTIVLWMIGFYLFGIEFSAETIGVSFFLIFRLHFITDYISSRITGYYWKKQNSYGFFSVIGFDQVLHYFQIFLIYHYIILKN